MQSDTLSSVGTQARHIELIRQYLSSGCDERIYINEQGGTRYWINPMEYQNLVHRGSCTCGTLNDANVHLMNDLLDADLTIPGNYEQLLDQQTIQLKELINFEGEDTFEVLYAPSGSDLAYFPMIFGKILHPERPVLNIVSCPEELGSGTLHAVKGEYHAEFNQFDEAVSKGDLISSELNIKVISLDARSPDGKIINHEAYIKEQIDKHPDHSIVVSLVYGSKSGIEDNLDLIEKIDRKDIIWSVDMCQFRHSRKIIHRLMEQNACVMITGSKFYQAPPFCGAMLVSKSFLHGLDQCKLEVFSKFSTIFSGYDLPAVIRSKAGLPMRENVGLRLRWACSLNEISEFRKIPKGRVRKKIDEWNGFIMSCLEGSKAFEPMPDQRITNKTIISFRVRKDDRYMDHLQLKELYRLVVRDGRIEPGATSPEAKNVFIGQPVAYGDKSFLRLAIGSMCIREFIENEEISFIDDAEILSIIESKIDLVEVAQ